MHETIRRHAAPCTITALTLAAWAGCAAPRASAPAAGSLGAATAAYAVIDKQKAAVPAVPMGDAATIARILDEGENRNQVMDHLTHLSVNIGPRLTGSSNAEAANRWARDRFAAWGLAIPAFGGAKDEASADPSMRGLWQWGQIATRFDRGPSTGKILAVRNPAAETPEYRTVREVEFTTLAWTAGTNGPVRGPVIKMPETDEQLEAVKSRVKGAWVLTRPGQGGRRGVMGGAGARMQLFADIRRKQAGGEAAKDAAPATMEEKVLALGPAGWILPSISELVLTGGAPGWDKMDPDTMGKDLIVTVRQSDYDCMNSRLADGTPVEAEFDLKHTFTKGPIPVYDTIAEIRGTEKPDEVIIVSGHLDSWNGPGAQGTTDNGTGSAVTLEAARLLAVAKARPKRTIRFILWTGEEQGLLGSVAYVKYLKDHGQLEKVSAVLVDDGGTNYEGGLSCVPNQVEYLAAATAPVNGRFYSETDKKFLDVNIHAGATFTQVMGSDHNSFMREKIPGFFWDEEGRADYNHTHHTQYDKLDQAIPEYLRQSATCAAVTAYNLACAPGMLPRPTDEQWPQGRGGGRRGGAAGAGAGGGAGGGAGTPPGGGATPTAGTPAAGGTPPGGR